MNEFTLKTEGHYCFLCSEPCLQVKSEPGLDFGSPATPTPSIQSLSRYLKLDMRKVFNEEGPISPQLLATVENARLKVELCEECTSLNKTFSKLYRKLERVNMEVKSCLSSIHTKFLKARKATKLNKNDEDDGRAQIMKNLRNDGMEKCAARLSNISPRLRIQRMTTNQVDEKMHELKIISRENVATNVSRGSSENSTTYNGDWVPGGAVKMERLTSDHPISANEKKVEDGYFDYSDNMETEELEQATKNTVNHDDNDDAGVVGETVHVSYDFDFAGDSLPKRGTRKCTRNSVTGKYNCGRSFEFNSAQACHYHYNSVHLKAIFKCNLCGKEFTQPHNFQRHHKNVHMGLRFKCLGCSKEFRYRSDLTKHQRISSCGVGLSK